MNKKLLIAAVGAALAAGSMAASAAPTVYGKLNVGVASVDNGVESSLGVTDDASRLGVKGDEDVGGGMKVIYMWEMGIRADDGGYATSTSTPSGQATRDAYLGVQAGWGSVRLGQYNTGYKNLSTGLEIFGDTIGDFTHTEMSGETRPRNTIGYSSPNFNGFKFTVESTRGEQFSPTESNPMNIAASFSQGPLYIGVGRYDWDNQGATGDDTSTKIVASYAFGPAKIWVVKDSTDQLGTSTKDDVMHIGASFTAGNNTFAVTHTNYENDDVDAAKQIAVGMSHALSKSSKVNIVYSKIDNETGNSTGGRMLANTGLGTSSNAPITGDSVTGWQVQLSTSF